MEEEKQPLKEMANAFKELANAITSQSLNGVGETPIELGQFCRACSSVSPFFRHLGIAMKFAELDYVAKADDLVEASKSIPTVPVMIDGDIEAIVCGRGNSLIDPASKAYAQVFAPHHGWAIRKAAAAGMYALPAKAQLLKRLNEDETSSRIHMRVFIVSAAPIIMYVDQLFMSRELGIDW